MCAFRKIFRVVFELFTHLYKLFRFSLMQNTLVTIWILCCPFCQGVGLRRAVQYNIAPRLTVLSIYMTQMFTAKITHSSVQGGFLAELRNFVPICTREIGPFRSVAMCFAAVRNRAVGRIPFPIVRLRIPIFCCAVCARNCQPTDRIT